MNKLKHISQFALEGKISQKHAEEIDEMIEQKLKAERNKTAKGLDQMCDIRLEEQRQEIIEQIKKNKEATQKETGSFKYDFCYDEIINIIKTPKQK